MDEKLIQENYEVMIETALELEERIRRVMGMTEDHAGVRQTLFELLDLLKEMNPEGYKNTWIRVNPT
jgi:hypothetical protein